MTRKQAFDAEVNHWVVVIEELVKKYTEQGMSRDKALVKAYHEAQAQRDAAR